MSEHKGDKKSQEMTILGIKMKFYGTFLIVSIMLLLSVVFLIMYVFINFPAQYFLVEGMFFGVGLFLFILFFHEFCHLIGILITHNQDIVRGLALSYKAVRIRHEGKVPLKDASMVYLSSLITVPVVFIVSYFSSQKLWLNFVLIEFALPMSFVEAIISIPFTLAMSKWDISDWRRIRSGIS